MLESKRRLTGANVPEFDREVARCRGENIFGRRIEKDLSDLSDRGLVTLLTSDNI